MTSRSLPLAMRPSSGPGAPAAVLLTLLSLPASRIVDDFSGKVYSSGHSRVPGVVLVAPAVRLVLDGIRASLSGKDSAESGDRR